MQRVYQPHPEAVTLEIRAKGKTLTLYFSADPETARLHLRSKKPLNPPTPPPFCQLLRAHLEAPALNASNKSATIASFDLICSAMENP